VANFASVCKYLCSKTVILKFMFVLSSNFNMMIHWDYSSVKRKNIRVKFQKNIFPSKKPFSNYTRQCASDVADVTRSKSKTPNFLRPRLVR